MNDALLTPIEYLKGVGPIKADLLKKELNIFTFSDLLHHYPFRYVDRTKITDINQISDDTLYVQLKGKIISKSFEGATNKKRLVAHIQDETGVLELVWFQSTNWIEKMVQVGYEYIVFGKPTLFNRKFSISHPELEIYSEEKVKNSSFQAVYSTTDKLRKHKLDSNGILALQKNLFEQIYNLIDEILPKNIIYQYKLMSRNLAFLKIHFPKDNTELLKASTRLKFEEVFLIQVQLIHNLHYNKQKYKGFTLKSLELFNEFYHNHLPFSLTKAQQKVIKEIYRDLCSGQQMNRLLQGDVGSGKTIVAFLCALIAIGNQTQACLMAPTEILAEQHFIGLKELSDKIGLYVVLLTGSTKTAKKREILNDLKEGNIHLIIGTHALIEDDVKFKSLGLCIIDEQHRFGVSQRAKLWQKNESKLFPHILVMTATPIPRTLAMTFYGDLDTSTIDELPVGRKEIKTHHRYDEKRLLVFSFIRDELKKGRQIYFVYPMITESEKSDLKNLEDGYESIINAFPDVGVGVVHGKMKSETKDEQMNLFVTGQTKILVATTVIEVGINVPNASVMIIENANRFGLAQLHQLRGRVGRGAEQSYCILMTDYKLSNEARIRIETMCKTTNGFEIAEMDLKLRGPGDLLGTQQSGILDLKLTDLNKDANLIKECRFAADQLIKQDPNLTSAENYMLVKYLKSNKKSQIDLGKVG